MLPVAVMWLATTSNDDAHAVLVRGLAQALQVRLGAHYPVADGGVGRLVHVVPVLGEDHALTAAVNGRDGLRSARKCIRLRQ